MEDSLQRDFNVKHLRDNLNLVIFQLKATYHLTRALKFVLVCVAFQSRDSGYFNLLSFMIHLRTRAYIMYMLLTP